MIISRLRLKRILSWFDFWVISILLVNSQVSLILQNPTCFGKRALYPVSQKINCFDFPEKNSGEITRIDTLNKLVQMFHVRKYNIKSISQLYFIVSKILPGNMNLRNLSEDNYAIHARRK